MKKIISIVGARPQFIKHAPIELALKSHPIHLVAVHTGQHYDQNMSKVFFDQLGMRTPDYMLQAGSAGHGVQTGKMMMDLEPIFLQERPDAVLVYGDTNSTLAGALVAAKLNIPIIHLEAGLRSYNREMPEEVNRVLTDHLSALLLAPTQQAIDNLAKEGIQKNVSLTGDVMCDMLRLAQKTLAAPAPHQAAYAYASIHRPYNTDNPEQLGKILTAFQNLSIRVKFAIHPRTRHKMELLGWNVENYPNIEFLPPLSYFDNIHTQAHAQAVITDSGGIQKEAYLLGRKCLTVRTETEWVETLAGGWNTLVFDRLDVLETLLQAPTTDYNPDLYGDGRAAEHIAQLIADFLG